MRRWIVPSHGGHAPSHPKKEHPMRRQDHLGSVDLSAIRFARGRSCTHSDNGLPTLLLTIAACLLLATTASATDARAKRQLSRSWHGYGFLPGYRPPEVIEWEAARARRPTYWYGGPGFYRGRWNGGGFGPCWTPTPIGPHWNCG